MRVLTRLVSVTAVCALAGSAALAQGGPMTLNYLPGGTDVIGRAPELFVNLRDNFFAVVDPLDARIVIVDSAGRILGSSAPLSIVPTRVEETPTALAFVEGDTGRRAVVPRSAEPTSLGAITIEDAPPRAAAPSRRVSRRGNSLVLPIDERHELVVRPLAGGRLTNVELLGVDREGRTYAQTSEVVRSQPRIVARSFVHRFSPQRRFLDAAQIPIADMDSVPSRTVALAPSGEVSAIVPTKDSLFLQTLSFTPLPHGGRAMPQPASPAKRTPIDATVQEPSRGPLSGDMPMPAAPLPQTTRSAILERANAYLNVNWTMRPENFSRPGVEDRCAKTEGKFWQRPRRFNTDAIGKTFGPMPYHWGGGDTPESFRTKVAAGSLAGSVCTCREPAFNQCVVSFAAGVDCSGFVSRTWGIPKRGTTGLGQVAQPVNDITKLRLGDALNKAGSHVRLFIGFKPGAELLFEVLKSATNLRCEGVCRSTYTLQQLAGYQPLRFAGTRD